MSNIQTKSVIAIFLAFLSFVAAQPPPFQFGSAFGDVFTGPSNNANSTVALPKPMLFLGSTIASVRQFIDGTVNLETATGAYGGSVFMYTTNIDTSNGGVDKNGVWLRAGNRAADLERARFILARAGPGGALFDPQAIVVATWNNVEAYNRRVGPQNTFQLAMAYNGAGETWAILSFSQLQFYEAEGRNIAFTYYQDSTGLEGDTLFIVNSNATMNAVTSGSDVKITGIYARKVNDAVPTAAPTSAPTKNPTTKAPTRAPVTEAPTSAPTTAKCGLFGWRIFCPFTLCGIFGRGLGFCQSD